MRLTKITPSSRTDYGGQTPISFFPDFLRARLTSSEHSFTEVAMILICSSLPILPKFFQMFRKKRNVTSYVHLSKDEFSRQHRGTSSKYSNTLTSKGSVSVPWEDKNGPTSQLTNAYIPLKEVEASHGRSTKVTGGYAGHAGWGLDEAMDVENYPGGNAITKTVRMESREDQA